MLNANRLHRALEKVGIFMDSVLCSVPKYETLSGFRYNRDLIKAVVAIRNVPMSYVFDEYVSTLIKSLSDIDLRGIILVLDRDFFSEDNMDELMDGGLNFIMPARRNSLLYGKVARKLTDHLFYQDTLVRFSKKRADHRFLYLYQDGILVREEENTLYRMLNDGKLDNDEFRERMWKAGKILIISNMDTDGKRVYEMYKGREDVEQQFDTFKSTLHSDIMYLRDDESVFGHMFVAFLSLYCYCTMQNMLRKESLLEKISPADLLEEFSSVYAITDGERVILTEVPKRARELDE